MSTATKARVDTAYQRLREHLAYLGLSTAAEELAPALDRAAKQKLSAVAASSAATAGQAAPDSAGPPAPVATPASREAPVRALPASKDASRVRVRLPAVCRPQGVR